MFLSYGSIIGESTYSNKEPITLRAPLLNIEIIAYASDDGCIIIDSVHTGIVTGIETHQQVLILPDRQSSQQFGQDAGADLGAAAGAAGKFCQPDILFRTAHDGSFAS